MGARLLGAVGFESGGTFVSAGTAKQCCLFAALALSSARPVSSETLIHRLWGDDPPRAARSSLHSYVARLRKLLSTTTGSSATVGLELVSHDGGYRLVAEPDDVDVLRMRATAATARAAVAAGDDATAATLLRAAVGQWRGVALAGIGGDWAEQIRAGLEGERLALTTEAVSAELRLGRHAELVAELTELVAAHPLAESLVGQLMLALHGCGRTAEAVDWFARTRRRLREGLGVEPGPDLREIHHRVLRAALPEGGTREEKHDPEPVEGRNHLPRDISDFIGRERHLRRLTAPAANQQAPVVHAIDGMPGSGKTTLAIHVAHLLAPRYPDGQLFVDLRGHVNGQRPMEPAAALDTLLRQLGISPHRIPVELDDRIALWRAQTAHRRLLVLYDNAADVEQVSALLPAGRSCFALVTSRSRLGGLEVGHPHSLATMPPADAVELFRRIVGAERSGAEPRAVAEVTQLCGYLPLAIRLAGIRLVHRPQWAVEHLVERLRDEERRLEELTVSGRGVGTAFTLSYETLQPIARRIFRLVGLIPGGNVDAPAVAAMAELPLSTAERVLQRLVDGHLVEERTPGRYHQHDLLRQYANDLQAADDGAAVSRLLDHYLRTATGASVAIGDIPLGPPITPEAPVAMSPADAVAWFGAERQNLICAIRYAARTGQEVHAWKLARALWRFLHGHSNVDCLEVTTVGLAAARQISDATGEATLSCLAALTMRRTGQRRAALDLLLDALAGWRRIGARAAETSALGLIGLVCSELGDYPGALEYAGRGLGAVEGFAPGRACPAGLGAEVLVRWALGTVSILMGRHADASAHLRRGLDVCRTLRDPYLEGIIRTVLAEALERLGRHDAAVEHLERALHTRRINGYRRGEAETLIRLGSVRRAQGRVPEAVVLQRSALDILLDVVDPHGEAKVRNELGTTLVALGEPTEAAAQHRHAVTLAIHAQQPYEEGRAHAGLARIMHGEPRVEHDRIAREIFDRIGAVVPEPIMVGR